MKAAIITNNPPETELYQLAEILVKLRYYTARFDEHHGYQARTKKKQWEKKADQWIQQHVKEVTELL